MNGVTFLAFSHKMPGQKGKLIWHCRCHCGQEFASSPYSITSRHTQSCGCLHKALIAAMPPRRSHNMCGTAEYRAWCGMKKRCLNPKDPKFPDYGGRGIVICDRWLNCATAFLADMGAKPSPQHSLDRINNDGPYSPENCRWADAKTQATNQRKRRPTRMNPNSLKNLRAPTSEEAKRIWDTKRADDRTKPKTCHHCGTEFYRRGKQGLFCSLSCYHLHRVA